jgi:hypothetical protein
LHRAEIINANDIVAREHKTMKSMKIKNLLATACNPTIK